MPEKEEPGMLDTIMSLLADTGSEYKCESCGREGSYLLVKCACGWKLEACFPCTIKLPAGSEDHPFRLIGNHIQECEQCQR